MRCRRLSLALLLATAAPAWAQVTSDDLLMLELIYRNRFTPFSAENRDNPEVAGVVEEVSATPRNADPVERYKAMIKGVAIMHFGHWDEGAEVASILDVTVGAKLYQPGGAVRVDLEPLYHRGGVLSGHYIAEVMLMASDGQTVDLAQIRDVTSLEGVQWTLTVPDDAPAGRYAVEYSLRTRGGDVIVSTRRSIYVLDNLAARLASLSEKIEQLAARTETGASQTLAASTVRWHHGVYSRGQHEDLSGAYMGYPVIMNRIFEGGTLMAEMLDFAAELALAEELAKGLVAGEDPLHGRSGDMHLAYRSSLDQELVPFRIYVPRGFDLAESYPLVVALHGAGGDENTYMDGFQGKLKQNAERRGYIAVSVNGRGPYGGYRGASARDVLEVLDLVQAIYPIDRDRTYLTGHSMGGGGTVRLGFQYAKRFAAIAPIAGYGSDRDLQKATNMPLFIAQGDKDALVPVDRARVFYRTTQRLGMFFVEYVEKAGADHVGVVGEVMDQMFDWFDAHKK